MGKIIDYINENVSLHEEYFRIFGRELPSGKFTCPNPEHMHKSNTPSCKVYGNKFKCFGQCSRMFGVYDLLKWYNPKRIDEIVASSVIEKTERRQTIPVYKVTVDRSLSLVEVLKSITGICLNSLK